MKMNQKLIMVLAVSTCLTLPVTAQQTKNSNDSKAPGNRDSAEKVDYKGLEKASKIIGTEVTDLQDKKLGKVKDLAVDMQAGRIAEVIIGTGGFIGMDEKMIGVPPECLTFANSAKELRLADAEPFKTSPFFKLSHWNEATSSASVAEVYRHYHMPNDANFGYLERADKIMGISTRNLEEKSLGKVENLVVDLSGGRVVEVILASGGFLGIKDELSAVPPQAFHLNPAQDMLTLDVTRESLKNAPHFKPRDWRDSVNDSMSLAVVYKAYNVAPYFTPGSTDTIVQNAAPRGAMLPANSADTQNDAVITARIQQLILAANGLSPDARRVEVTSKDGRVTLRGLAASEKEKKQLGELAATVVAAGRVDNQIEVKNIGATTSINND